MKVTEDRPAEVKDKNVANEQTGKVDGEQAVEPTETETDEDWVDVDDDAAEQEADAAVEADDTADSEATAVVKKSKVVKTSAVKSGAGKAKTGAKSAAKSGKSATAAKGAEAKEKAESSVKTAPVRRPATDDRGLPIGKIVVGVVMAALIAATGFFGYHYFAGDDAADTQGTNEQRVAVLSVANDYAVKLATFDYRDLEKNREAITAMSTAEFGAKYDEMVEALTEIVASGQGEASATVINSAVESIEGDEATVLLFTDQTAKNVVAPEGRNQPYRMVIELKNVDGKWLVDNVETV